MDFVWKPSVETVLRCISTFSGLQCVSRQAVKRVLVHIVCLQGHYRHPGVLRKHLMIQWGKELNITSKISLVGNIVKAKKEEAFGPVEHRRLFWAPPLPWPASCQPGSPWLQIISDHPNPTPGPQGPTPFALFSLARISVSTWTCWQPTLEEGIWQV